MRTGFGIFLTALALAVTGCGGGSDTTGGDTTAAQSTDTVAVTDTTATDTVVATDTSASTDTTASGITKPEFIAQADALCAKAKADLTQQAAGITSQAEATKFLKDTALPAAEELFNQIEALGAPAGDEDTIGAILAAERSALDAAKVDPTAASSETDKANKLLTDYGLKVCGAA